MPDINLPLIQSYYPTSFIERGVAAPFTTPLLAGARVRPAERTGTELVVPNPSGGRGVYILPWGSVRQLCRPTVHDTRLFETIGQLPALTPAAIRNAARDIAAQGLAGREAQAAVAAAAEADNADRLLANFLLLMGLVEQMEPASVPDGARAAPTAELEQRAKRVVARVAPGLGRTPHALAQDLETLAAMLGPVGLPPQHGNARLPRLIGALGTLQDETAGWATQYGQDAIASLALSVSDSAGRIIGAANAALQDARSFASDVTSLLRTWRRTPEAVTKRLGRADWLLDGWDRVVLLWREARRPAVRRAALLEMAQLVPSLPQEAAMPGDTSGEPSARVVSMNEGWRSGAASFGLVARNERLRARNA